jgi:TolB-like protein
MRQRVGPFRILSVLGEGGMGVVYAAEDERLGRRVALKMIHASVADPSARERLRREARAGASVSHPHICQVHEVGEEDGELYVAMELLEGEPLSARLARGPMPPNEAIDAALQVLSALETLHARGLVHRDLKPSNVFLTPVGVKILDFGLALPVEAGAAASEARLTQTGVILGTPGYMAPEQWTQEPVGPATDLFALGALLFESLAGRPAFQGRSWMDVYHAVAYEQPPVLSGGPGVEAVDRIVQRALAKDPRDRYPSARAMADEVRAAKRLLADGETARVRLVARLVVLPFHVLRPDPETDFLAQALPDAVGASLSGQESLVVRSGRAAAKFAGPSPDLKAVAAEAQVDLALLGTQVRAGGRLRVAAQLVEVPDGTLLWSETAEVDLGDLFRLQDDLARRIAESLAAPLATRTARLGPRDVPASASAYEAYLRANQLSYNAALLPAARDLYRACLAEDPGYAPAWARIGRVYRVMAKYGHGDRAESLRLAEEAFRRALELNPDLSVAHNLFTNMEVEELGQARKAMTRLLERVRRRAADPDLFAGLVLACRFCGLLDASAAAHRRARRLDPGIRTSVPYTFWMQGDYARALSHEDQDPPWMRFYSLPLLGREADAIALCREAEARWAQGSERHMIASTRTALEGDRAACERASRAVLAAGFRDPEGLFFLSRTLARTGHRELAFETLERVVAGGFVPGVLARDPWLDPLRADPRFVALVARAESGHAEARADFEAARGPALLGP